MDSDKTSVADVLEVKVGFGDKYSALGNNNEFVSLGDKVCCGRGGNSAMSSSYLGVLSMVMESFRKESSVVVVGMDGIIVVVAGVDVDELGDLDGLAPGIETDSLEKLFGLIV